MIDDSPRPDPNHGNWYQPYFPPGYHWITGRSAWVVWQSAERRRSHSPLRRNLPILFELWTILTAWLTR